MKYSDLEVHGVYWMSAPQAYRGHGLLSKLRPWVVLSLRKSQTRERGLYAAPLTSQKPTGALHVPAVVAGKAGTVLLDSIRPIPPRWFRKQLGRLSLKDSRAVAAMIKNLFDPRPDEDDS